MARSLWKGPFFDFNLFLDVVSLKKKIETKARSSVVLPQWVGLEVSVYNGRLFTRLLVTENMIGLKLGEFVFTRKRAIHARKSAAKKNNFL
jgi:small subunit ribosomal protein S19